MANLNLSQFGEKLFFADADHTFIWDTANAISKRVSRNSWLNSGTLTSDAPVTISQTWNAVGQTFKALVVNAAGASGTNSASASLLLDLQVGGVSKFVVGKDGAIAINGGVIKDYGSGQLGIGGGGAAFLYASGNFIQSVSQFAIGPSFGSPTVFITRDADNTLALRNGGNAQTFNVYGTYTSGTSYERLTLSAPSAANAIIGTNKGSGGGTARGLEFQTDGVSRWSISTAGHLLAADNNTYDIGASGANRPRDIYAGGNGIFGGLISAQNGFRAPSSSQLIASANGIWRLTNSDANDFNRLQFGGTTASFPAIKRSSTTLQARLADDSAFAPVQGKLTTDTDYTATVVTPTGFLTLYDAQGTAYRVPCVLAP